MRFRNHRAGAAYPTTVVDVSDAWGAYRVEPKGDQWAAEQKPVPCQAPARGDPSLMNTGVSLSTNIAPDDIKGAASR